LVTELYLAFIIGIILSLLYIEKFGITPSGLIVPGYLSLVFDQPFFICLIFLFSFFCYLLVIKVLARYVILYGRRKFVAMLLVGVFLKLLLDFFMPNFISFLPFEIYEFRGIGVIVPGLIANSIQKQGFIPTIGSTLLLSFLTFVIVFVYNLV